MSWNADLVRTFAAVVDTGTFDQAARRLHLTPSAVSQRVKTLEQQVGRRLAQRSKPVRPTAAGQAVLRHARRLALIDQDLRTELGIDPDRSRTTIPVAVNADSLATWFLAPVARFAREHDVELDLRREDQDRTTELLRDGVVVAAVTSEATGVPGSRTTELGDLEYWPVAAPQWARLWTDADQRIKEAAPRVDYDRNDMLQNRWLLESGTGAGTGPRHLVPSSHDFARAIELGLGWGMLPAPHAIELLDRGHLQRLAGPTVCTSLYWQRWSSDSTTLAALTETVVREAARTLRPIGSRHT